MNYLPLEFLRDKFSDLRFKNLSLRNPIAIFTFEIEWVSQMAEAMLRPAVFMIVYTLLEQGWVAVFIFQEQGVTLRRNCEAIDPPRCFLVDGS